MNDEQLLRYSRQLMLPGVDVAGQEKLLAALRGGLTTVLIPQENVKDLEEIPDNVKRDLKIIPVSSVDEVLRAALVRMPDPVE